METSNKLFFFGTCYVCFVVANVTCRSWQHTCDNGLCVPLWRHVTQTTTVVTDQMKQTLCVVRHFNMETEISRNVTELVFIRPLFYGSLSFPVI